MKYPNLKEIKIASREQICRWYRFLNSPKNLVERKRMTSIVEKYKQLGGFTPELSKSIGW